MQIKLKNSKLAMLFPEGYMVEKYMSKTYRDIGKQLGVKDHEVLKEFSSNSNNIAAIYLTSTENAMPFGDTKKVIDEIHESLEENQGLIEVDSGKSPRGWDYIYSIVKTYDERIMGNNYFLRLNIGNPEEDIEINAYFYETGTTGMRDAIGSNFASVVTY